MRLLHRFVNVIHSTNVTFMHKPKTSDDFTENYSNLPTTHSNSFCQFLPGQLHPGLEG